MSAPVIALMLMAWADQAPSAYLQPYSQMTGETRAKVAPYWNCVMQNVRLFVRSPDPASDVATAAIAGCRDERTELESAIAGDVLTAGANVDAEAVMVSLDRELADRAILEVVRTRASGGR